MSVSTDDQIDDPSVELTPASLLATDLDELEETLLSHPIVAKCLLNLEFRIEDDYLLSTVNLSLPTTLGLGNQLSTGNDYKLTPYQGPPSHIVLPRISDDRNIYHCASTSQTHQFDSHHSLSDHPVIQFIHSYVSMNYDYSVHDSDIGPSRPPTPVLSTNEEVDYPTPAYQPPPSYRSVKSLQSVGIYLYLLKRFRTMLEPNANDVCPLPGYTYAKLEPVLTSFTLDTYLDILERNRMSHCAENICITIGLAASPSLWNFVTNPLSYVRFDRSADLFSPLPAIEFDGHVAVYHLLHHHWMLYHSNVPVILDAEPILLSCRIHSCVFNLAKDLLTTTNEAASHELSSRLRPLLMEPFESISFREFATYLSNHTQLVLPTPVLFSIEEHPNLHPAYYGLSTIMTHDDIMSLHSRSFDLFAPELNLDTSDDDSDDDSISSLDIDND